MQHRKLILILSILTFIGLSAQSQNVQKVILTKKSKQFYELISQSIHDELDTLSTFSGSGTAIVKFELTNNGIRSVKLSRLCPDVIKKSVESALLRVDKNILEKTKKDEIYILLIKYDFIKVHNSFNELLKQAPTVNLDGAMFMKKNENDFSEMFGIDVGENGFLYGVRCIFLPPLEVIGRKI
jgi:hypothetical protein